MSRLRKNNAKAVEVVEELDAVETVEAVEEVTEVSAIDKAVKTAETVSDAEVAEVAQPKGAEPKIRINPKQDVRTYVGDQWYNLKAGKQVSVPRTVKEKLQKAGLLNPL